MNNNDKSLILGLRNFEIIAVRDTFTSTYQKKHQGLIIPLWQIINVGEMIGTKFHTNHSDDSLRLVAILVDIIVTNKNQGLLKCLFLNNVQI